MPPEPLPLRSAAVANRLNMMLSETMSSTLASMNMPTTRQPLRSSAAIQNSRRSRPVRGVGQEEKDGGDDDDDDILDDEKGTYGQGTQGIGYVSQSHKDSAKREGDNAALSSRLLGKRRLGAKEGNNGKRQATEDSEDEDEGRGSLGKRKRPRKAPQPGEDENGTPDPAESSDVRRPENSQTVGDDIDAERNLPAPSLGEESTILPASTNKKKRKKNKSKKRKDAE